MPSETIITQLRLAGQRAYVAGMDQAAKKTKFFDDASTRAGRTAGTLGGKLDSLAQSFWRVGGQAGFALGIVGAAAIDVGLKFDAGMERAGIGMESLLKNAKLAKQTVANVRDFALKAPLFGVEQMMQSAQQMIGAGYDAKKVVPILTTFSDTLSALGRKPEDLQRMTYAFVQMMSKGQISAEELRGQLGEIMPAQKILAREMGISSKELAARMKEGEVKGVRPLQLLLRGMEKDFGGSTSKMAKTFDGQLANIKESSKYVLGTLFMPLFKTLENKVFPNVAKFGSAWQKVLENNNMTAEQKWRRTKQLAQIFLEPLVRDFGKWIDKMDIPGKVTMALDKALPVLGDKATELAQKGAWIFVKAWWHANAWTKIFVLWMFLGKMGLWKTLGTMAAERFVAKFAATSTGAAATAKVAGAGTTLGGKFGAAFSAAAGPLAVIGITAYLDVELNKWIKKQSWWKPPGGKDSFWDNLIPDTLLPKKTKGNEDKSWGDIIRNGPLAKALFPSASRDYDPRFDGPILRDRGPKRPEIFAPHIGGFPRKPKIESKIELHNYVMLDGKVASKSVAKVNSDKQARK
jgi:tape measure domain-containing protein